jgi:SAM-dependent methyltransferase
MTLMHRYTAKQAQYFKHARPELLDLFSSVYPNGTGYVVELGCGEGHLGAAIRQQGQVGQYDGIELVPAAAAVARTQLSNVYSHDLNGLDLASVFGRGRVDCLICADVLEHLLDPWALLASARDILKPDGVVIASIPNLRNVHVVRKILFDRWAYEPEGILDITHLRFFTLSSIRSLFADSGFAVCEIRRRAGTGPIFRTAIRLSLGLLREFGVQQYLVCARPAESQPAS